MREPLRDAAHPRSRGENHDLFSLVIVDRGSSPLTRGKLGPGGTEPQRVRLIPAHAGKTIFVALYQNNETAHPRSRGENSIVVGMVKEGLGSSPLTRGKPALIAHTGHAGRLIPAHAGKTRGDPHLRDPAWAHPRSRGENP